VATLIHLDTHVVVWLYLPRVDLLSVPARELIERCELRISPMVLLELEYLREIGRLAVASDTIYEELEQRVGLTLCDHEFRGVIRAASKQTWTRDPFDRVIVGQARAATADLVTREDSIRANYPRARW
jgi:PIN domain nuclease of toxin-antitoxin system